MTLAACHGGTASSADHAVGGLKPPGTAIWSGFTVAPGSELEGTVFPPTDGANDVWTAVLKVTGDPLTVANAYVKQAERLHFDPTETVYPGGCDEEVGSGDTFASHALGSDSAPVRAVTCDLASQDQTWDLDLRVGRGISGDRGYSYAIMQGPVHRRPPTNRGGGSPIHRIVGHPPDIEAWQPGRTPAVGDRIDDGVPPTQLTRGLTVAPGTAVVDTVLIDYGCSGGYYVVEKVTGDANQVLGNYARQFAANGFHGGFAGPQRLGVTTSRTLSTGSAGGGDLTEELATDRDRTQWLLLRRCND